MFGDFYLKKTLRILTALAFFSLPAFAAPLQIDYYGVVSTAQDTNMLKMAQDLFYTQLNSIDNLSISDRRPDTSTVSTTPPDLALYSSRALFYAEITETKKSETETTWNCVFNMATPSDGKIYSSTKFYSSYYKMLTTAKETIEDLVAPLRAKLSDQVSQEESYSEQKNLPPSYGTDQNGFSAESLSGTWSGEPYTDKIVILRGGRGFIIFKNGATMNISVRVSGKQVLVKQAGKANASFFPELSRETALAAAASAPPIEWSLTIQDSATLTGTKKTLVKTNSEPESVSVGTENVTWTKR